MSARPIACRVTLLAVLLIGAVAAGRTTFSYLPVVSFPELEVDLRLPAAGDLDDLARRWVVPLESAARAAGAVVGLAGEVDPSGVYLRVRFRAGTDAERKGARLESELVGLRRRLPPGGRLSVRPVRQGAGESSAIVWLGTDEIDPRLLEAVRDLPEVRTLTVAGEARDELRVRPHDGGRGDAVAAAIEEGLGRRLLGEVEEGGRTLPVYVAGRPDRPLSSWTVRRRGMPMPLAAVADLALERQDARWTVRVQGRPGRVLLIVREAEASPLALGRSLRRCFAEFGLSGDRVRMLYEEAAPLRELLERLVLGFLVASGLAVLLAWRLAGAVAAGWWALGLPAMAAACCYLLWLAGLPLDVATLPAAWIGLSCGLAASVLRSSGRWSSARVWGVTVASAAALPVTVALAGGTLAPFLAAPSRAFLLAVTASLAVSTVIPAWPARRSARLARPLRWALRNPWTVLLGAGVAAYLAVVISGRSLVPHTGSVSPPIADLVVRLRLPEGATPARAADRVSAAEAHLDGVEEVSGHWSVFSARGAALYVSVRGRDRDVARLRALAVRLQSQLASGGASVVVSPLVGGAGEEVRFTGEIRDLPESDEAATFYRLILRHPEAAVLRALHSHLLDGLTRYRYSIWQDRIHTEWGPPTTRLEWVPRAGADPSAVEEAARLAKLGGSFPLARPLPARGEVDLRVVDPRAPAAEDQVRQRRELLGLQAAGPDAETAVAPPALFEVRELIGSPSMKRQSGRFTVPVTLRIRGFNDVLRRDNRASVDRFLAKMPLPDGAVLERPELNPAVWSRERLRMLILAAALPCLLFGLAAFRLDALVAGVAALTPACLAVLAAAPWIQAGRGHVDELTLTALAAAVAGSLPWSLEAAARTAGDGPLAGGFTYRWLARRLPAAAVVLPVVVVLLAVPGLGLDPERQVWVLPLRVAGVALVVVAVAGLGFLPVLLRTLRRLRRPAEERRRAAERAHPPAWRSAGTADLELSVHRVSKIYGGELAALRSVSFELGSGVVGLLGPNGAGKTTLLRLLCGLLEPTRGRVLFRGVAVTPENLPEYRRLVGYLPQEFNAYEGFTGARFLDYWAIERGIDDPRERRREVEKRLAQVGLEEAAGRKVRDFSGGMRRRIGIARALLGAPPIVIVDEPTTGLDVESRNRLRESLLAVAGERVILFSTHIASDVAATASRILLLHRGRLLYDGAASGLVRRAEGRVFETEVGDADLREFSTRYRVTTRVRTLGGIRVRALLQGDGEPAGPLVEPNLEEAYLVAMGEAQGISSRERRSHGASLLDLGP